MAVAMLLRRVLLWAGAVETPARTRHRAGSPSPMVLRSALLRRCTLSAPMAPARHPRRTHTLVLALSTSTHWATSPYPASHCRPQCGSSAVDCWDSSELGVAGSRQPS